MAPIWLRFCLVYLTLQVTQLITVTHELVMGSVRLTSLSGPLPIAFTCNFIRFDAASP